MQKDLRLLKPTTTKIDQSDGGHGFEFVGAS